jgi:hypothetical protein
VAHEHHYAELRSRAAVALSGVLDHGRLVEIAVDELAVNDSADTFPALDTSSGGESFSTSDDQPGELS